MQLARRAEVSLDVQYYHFENDETGRYLLRALRDAAERGVRVRLLIDDFYTSGEDDFFLASPPTRTSRCASSTRSAARAARPDRRFAASVGDWTRVNHRMHNKLFIADGAMAVIGGRNVANEYFLRGMGDNFIDVDAFTVGPVRAAAAGPVRPLLEQRRRSTRSRRSRRAQLPRPSCASSSTSGPARRSTPPPAPLPPNDILGYGPIADDLDGGRLGLIWGEAYVFADHPDKPFEDQADGELLETSVTYNVFEAIKRRRRKSSRRRRTSCPGRAAWRSCRSLRDRGVKLTRDDQLARRDRRAGRAPRLQPLPRATC